MLGFFRERASLTGKWQKGIPPWCTTFIKKPELRVLCGVYVLTRPYNNEGFIVDMFIFLLVPAAVALDFALGDPHGWPHPVRSLGDAAGRMDAWARGFSGGLRLKGTLCAGALALAAWAIAWGLVSLPFLGGLLALYLAYAGLALGSLLSEGRGVLRLVETGDLEGARAALAMLVSRDTSSMDEGAVCRALAETLSENLGDGFAAPFLYLVLFGVPGMWAYKAVSTLDSMWGYKTERYLEFGWAAARADDVLAFVPSRLAAFAIMAAARLDGGANAFSLSEVRRDAGKLASPNAGWPMAAAAWAVGASMGGPAVYFGKDVDKPRLGPEGESWTPDRVRELLRIVRMAGLLLAGALWGGWLLVAAL